MLQPSKIFDHRHTIVEHDLSINQLILVFSVVGLESFGLILKEVMFGGAFGFLAADTFAFLCRGLLDVLRCAF